MNDIRSKKVVDSREPESIREILLQIGWKQEAMYSCDYTFFDHNFKRVGIERKTVSDLLLSLGDKLARQLLNMTEWCEYTVLIIEGKMDYMTDGHIVSNGTIANWYWSTVWNYLQTWQHKGITIQRTADEHHTIKRLSELYAYYQKPGHAGGLHKKSVDDQRILALQCGGIGEKLGEALLNHFGSLRAIANATAQDFMSIDKIGKNKAINLYNHFNKDGRNGTET